MAAAKLSAERRSLAVLAAVFVAVQYCWDWPLMRPLWIPLLYLHELGHGLGAWLSGGGLNDPRVWLKGAEHAGARGGDPLMVMLGGNVGSYLWGLALILASPWKRPSRWGAGLLGLAVAGLAFFHVTGRSSLVFGLAVGAFLVFSARRLPDEVNGLALKVAGAASCALSVSCVKMELLDRKPSQLVQDLAARTHLSPRSLTGAWLLACLLGLYLAARLTAKSARD